MANRTDNRGYIYPECDPPLVKDRSDIDWIRQLAVEVDNDATGVAFKLQEFLEKPDAARVAFTGGVTTSGSGSGFQFTVPYDTVTYDNTPGSTALGSFAISPRERGWYMFTSTVRCTNGGEQGTSVRHLLNSGDNGRAFEGPSFPINGNEENMAISDIMQCEAGDLITTRVLQSGAGGTFTFECRLTMIQLRKLDV